MNKWVLGLGIALLIVLPGCRPANDIHDLPSSELPTIIHTPTEVIKIELTVMPSDNHRRVGLPLATIQLEEQVTIGKSGYSLTFDEIITDSRCPEDATCVWAGQIKIQLSLLKDDLLIASFILTEGEQLDGETNVFAYAPIQITLIDVLPRPRLDDKSQQMTEAVLQIEIIE